ncbi:unnamed protein product, partial [Onchocerca ochengi]|uniref:Bm1715 n=1 Tax=Onchocerca ochengi TaxID=42157 RepID=A0A182EI31_ONCOC
MLKIPKSSRNRCLSQTGNQISSTSLLRRLVKYSGEKFHQTTRITRSILRKRFTNTSTSSVGLVSSKEVELSIKRRSAENFNSCVLTVLPEIGSVELGKDEMEYIDAEGDDPNCCRNKYTMKRGFRYLFNQEKLDDRDDDLDMGIEQKRGFFQKFFRPTSSRSLGGVEGTSTELEGRSLLHDNDNYAVIDKRQDEFVISINKDKREMSAPVSPKNVTFEDELSTTDRRGQSVAPHAAFLANPIGTTLPMQQAFNNFNYDTSQISTVNSRRDIQLTPARSSLSDREHLSPMSSSHEASLALDEATHDLLRLSSQPPSVWYSSSSRLLPAADRIPKSASTTSMNKVIRTEDGGMLKLANVFTWDAARLSDQNHDSSHNSAYVDDKGQRHQTVTVYDEKKQGPPIVRTTVEGKLKMEKVVGADLISVEHCICSAWTIRDIVTHYKVKTTLGKRTLILEEDKSMDGQKGDFKMSLYEDGQLKTRDVADLQIPSNADKANYLSQLSQRLLHDIEMLDQHEEPKITTRVEVEITENVTKILKTYIVGERNDLFLSVDQTATDATDAIRPSSDFKFLFEGHQYEDRSEIRPYQRADSDTTTTTESIAQRHLPPLCINVECNLKRIEDHSLNEVNVQMPNVFSVVLSLIRERIPQQLPSLVKYGMEQHGKQYSGETTIRRLHRYESTESSDELQTTMMQKERTFFFEKPERIEPVKIPVLNITELDLRRMADTSAILANFAIPRTDQSKLNIEHRYEFHEAGGRSYGMQQKGQHFEGEMILRKKRRFSLESESVSEEEVISGPTYLDLIKQEARGEFEVSIVLSNDERSSPKHFQASQSAETINLIAQISMDGKKEEVFAILAAKNKCKQVYMGQEIGTVTSNIMITMQKAVQLDDIFQQIIQRWNDKMVERIAMKISEFGNENEHVAVMLQRAGIMYGQVLSEWPEAVTGRLSITTTSSSSSTITTTNTFNIFEALTDSFGTNTGTDFLNTDLTNINTTTKRFHLPNFKTILPAYGAAQKIIPLINTCIVSMDLSNNYTQQIAKNSEEISVRIAHELDKTDKVEQQIDEEKVSLQMVVKTTTTTSKDYFKNDETEEQLEEMFDTFHIDRDTYMHEASIIMKPQSSRQNTHFSDQVKGLSSLSLHTIDECMQMQQNGTELSFTSDTHREHEKSPEQTISSMESTKKSSKTIDIPIIRMNETKTEDVSSTYKIFPKCKFETDEKRVISSIQIPTVASSNINSKKERLVGAQEQSNTEIKNANLHSVKTDSLLLFDLGRASDQPSGSMEYLNDSREMEEVFRESRSYFQNVRNNVNERQELMSRCSNIYEATATCNEVARSHEQLQYEQKRKRTHLQEFLYDIRQKEQQELRTFPQRENQKVFTSETSEIQKGTKIRIQREFEEMRDKSRESLPRSKLEREELKGKLYNGTSEMRVAMLHAGFNLDTTLLVTPEAMTQSKFARDYGATTSEYFSDERNTTYAYMKHSKIGNTQMTRSLTTDLEATRLKECLIETENECSIIPEICNYDVTVRKSEQSESSSVVHSAKYHQPKQPRQTVEDAMKALTVQKKEETVLKLDESSENHRDLTSLKTTAKHFQVQVPSLGFEYQNEIFQPTTSRTTKIEETIEQMVPKSAKDKYITAVSTDTERVEISKQEVEYNHNKLVNHQAFPQTMSTSPKVIVEIPEQKISQTDSINTYDKVKRSVEQAWSETALLTNYDLVTTLQMSTATSEKIERQVSCEERNTQFDAVVHFPFKPMKKSLLREIAVIEKETSITRDEIDVTAKTPEVKILQQQRKTEEEFEQIRQFETVERQMTTVGTFRESEFLEEIEQIEAEELTKTEHESKQFYQIERRSTNVETDGAIQADHGDISDVSRLDLEMKKASIIENVVTESKLVNYHQTAMTTSAMKEAEVTCNTDLRYIFDETIKDEQRNITTDYRTVEREASVNKNVSEKDLTAVQMLRQTIQAESIDKSNFLADQEALPDTEVVVETLESEAATSNFTFSDEYKEQLLRKSEEKMEHITTVEIPNKEITIASTTEYNKEVTSLNGVFLRSVIQETVEQCTEIIADR